MIYGSSGGRVIAVLVALPALESTPDGGNLFHSGGDRFSSRSNEWKAGYQGFDFLDVKFPMTSGFSATPGTPIGKRQVVYTDTRVSGGFPPYASVMVGDGPFGPWGEPKILGYFPEMAPSLPRRYHPDNACDAVHPLPDDSPDPGRVVALTYTVGPRSAFAKDMSRRLKTPAVSDISFATFSNPFAG